MRVKTFYILIIIFLSSCTYKNEILDSRILYATYYSDSFQGKKTASGEIFDQNKLTAAHRTIPLGSVARITNLENNKKVTIVINDRTAAHKNNIIDLSYKAAETINIVEKGKVKVLLEIIEWGEFKNIKKKN